MGSMADENLFLLHAFLLGIFITFVYDLLRILRRVIRHCSLAVSLEDLGFWGFCAVEVFLLMYREGNGTLRWFAVAGALLGMLLYHKTVSGLLVRSVSWPLRKLAGLLGRAGRFLGKPISAAAGKIGRIRKGIVRKRKSFSSFFKKRLTTSYKMLRMMVKKC